MSAPSSATSENKPLPMEQSACIDLLLKIITRYDTYIISTNAKASLIIAWNGVVIGSILLKYQDILGNFSILSPAYVWVKLIMVACGACAAISTAIIFTVVFPFLKPTRDGSKSLIFFGSVAAIPSSEYLTEVKMASALTFLEDLAAQASVLALGLDKKMRHLQYSINAIFIELALVFVLLCMHFC